MKEIEFGRAVVKIYQIRHAAVGNYSTATPSHEIASQQKEPVNTRPLSILSFAWIVSFSAVALADPRPFTFSNDTYPMGKGDWEYEQWVTWEVRTLVVDNTKGKTLRPIVREHVEYGSNVYTDALASYTGLAPEYVHGVIDHAECYVEGQRPAWEGRFSCANAENGRRPLSLSI